MSRSRVILLLTVAFAGACGQGEVETQPPAEEVGIVGTTWQWNEFQDAADGEEAHHIHVSDPARYTLTLRTGGEAHIQADCNRLTWTYTLEGSRLTFNPLGPSTLAACGAESLDQRYLERLASTVTYVIADGRLYLNLKADAGNLVFTTSE